MTEVARQRRDVERNREAILTASIAVLADEPHAAMNDIAVASGVGRSTLYRHFPDRAALMLAIHERVRFEADEVVRGHLGAAGDRDPVDVLVDLTDAIVDLGEGYRCLSNTDAAHRAKERHDRSRRGGHPLSRYIEAGQKAGSIRCDLTSDWIVTMLAHTFMAAIEDRLAESDSRRGMLAPTVRSLLTPPERSSSGRGIDDSNLGEHDRRRQHLEYG
jgi:AcrR family transcriptional regulator